MRPELATLIVHDLKNALGVLESELLALVPKPQHEPARQAHRHCAELRQRFVMFLTVYGIEGPLRAQPTDESPIDLLHGLAKAARSADGEATRDQAAVRLAPCAAAPAFWYFDHHLVRLALQAALHNAARFARHDIVLGARREDDHLVLSVDDDGPGLGAIDPSRHSTGLGTELCNAVARAHSHGGRNGRVSLFDRAQGGARFELWLP